MSQTYYNVTFHMNDLRTLTFSKISHSYLSEIKEWYSSPKENDVVSLMMENGSSVLIRLDKVSSIDYEVNS